MLIQTCMALFVQWKKKKKEHSAELASENECSKNNYKVKNGSSTIFTHTHKIGLEM